MKIGLIGDYQESITAHRAIPVALQLAADSLDLSVEPKWLPSDELQHESLDAYSGLWCVPASPYSNNENVFAAIEYARREDIPFLSTCGGYQYAALEFVRNELGYKQAENAEINPQTAMPVISGLSCKLYDERSEISFTKDSRIAAIYGKTRVAEEYYCGFGVNREYLNLYEDSDMRFSGFDSDGDPRSLEIPTHRFFIGTAFQPERSALSSEIHPTIRKEVSAHPLIVAFVAAVKCFIDR